jgi:hypothetical protein
VINSEFLVCKKSLTIFEGEGLQKYYLNVDIHRIQNAIFIINSKTGKNLERIDPGSIWR